MNSAKSNSSVNVFFPLGNFFFLCTSEYIEIANGLYQAGANKLIKTFTNLVKLLINHTKTYLSLNLMLLRHVSCFSDSQQDYFHTCGVLNAVFSTPADFITHSVDAMRLDRLLDSVGTRLS